MVRKNPDTERIKAEFRQIIDVARPQRLEVLIEEFSGSAAQLSDKTGIDATSIARMRYPPGKKHRKRIGEETAYLIERACGKPRGWLDGELREHQPDPLPPALTEQAVHLALAWESLDETLRAQLSMLIHTLAEQGSQRRQRPIAARRGLK